MSDYLANPLKLSIPINASKRLLIIGITNPLHIELKNERIN